MLGLSIKIELTEYTEREEREIEREERDREREREKFYLKGLTLEKLEADNTKICRAEGLSSREEMMLQFKVKVLQGYRIGQNVHSGFSILLWKHPNKLFDQPNIVLFLLSEVNLCSIKAFNLMDMDNPHYGG